MIRKKIQSTTYYMNWKIMLYNKKFIHSILSEIIIISKMVEKISKW